MYFLNLIANISESVEFLKYITPFGYCEVSDIVETLQLNGTYIGIGIVLSIIGIGIGFIHYCRKDIK